MSLNRKKKRTETAVATKSFQILLAIGSITMRFPNHPDRHLAFSFYAKSNASFDRQVLLSQAS